MRPVPETLEALRCLEVESGASAVAELEVAVQRMVDLVPDLVAYSLTVVGRALTLTYEGTPAHVDAGMPREPSAAVEDPLDEWHWHSAAQADAAPGIRSTLSLPIVLDGTVVGSVTLYGAGTDTFDGRHGELAAAAAAWEPGAVTNADLGYATRSQASLGPRVLADERTVEAAVTRLVSAHKVSRHLARRKLREAAHHAGIPVLTLALMVLEDASG